MDTFNEVSDEELFIERRLLIEEELVADGDEPVGVMNEKSDEEDVVESSGSGISFRNDNDEVDSDELSEKDSSSSALAAGGRLESVESNCFSNSSSLLDTRLK